jgi:hypothetical protein
MASILDEQNAALEQYGRATLSELQGDYVTYRDLQNQLYQHQQLESLLDAYPGKFREVDRTAYRPTTSRAQLGPDFNRLDPALDDKALGVNDLLKDAGVRTPADYTKLRTELATRRTILEAATELARPISPNLPAAPAPVPSVNPILKTLQAISSRGALVATELMGHHTELNADEDSNIAAMRGERLRNYDRRQTAGDALLDMIHAGLQRISPLTK